jgi:hypothetical protein
LPPVHTGPNSKDSSYGSLEGFIVARVTVGALRRAGAFHTAGMPARL